MLCWLKNSVILCWHIFWQVNIIFWQRICCNQILLDVKYRIWTCRVMSPCQKILYQLDGTNWTLKLCAKYLYMSNQWRNLTSWVSYLDKKDNIKIWHVYIIIRQVLAWLISTSYAALIFPRILTSISANISKEIPQK